MSFQPRILFIDAYDSFSHNIIALLETECDARVTRIYIDASVPDFEDFLLNFTAVVCGPGPGHPERLEDVGWYRKIWKLPESRLLPTLGICLGFQSLAHEFGASVVRLSRPRHGMKTAVASISTSIFKGLATFNTVQYHSLHARLDSDLSQSRTAGELWTPSKQCPHLQPLAWELGPQSAIDPSFSDNPPNILMGVKHIAKPFYGIQFHPESICSDSSSKHIIANWWQIALAWLPQTKPRIPSKIHSTDPFKTKWGYESSSDSSPRTSFGSTNSTLSEAHSADSFTNQGNVSSKVVSITLPAKNLTNISICDTLDLPSQDLIVLDSEMRQRTGLGEVSIIGVVLPQTRKIQYSSGSHKVLVVTEDSIEHIDLSDFDDSIFEFLKSFMSAHMIEREDDCAFYGGLMGYISYEACLETIGVDTTPLASRPDISFAFIERSILVDHTRNLIQIQGLQHTKEDKSNLHWVKESASLLRDRCEANAFRDQDSRPLSLAQDVSRKVLPEESQYRSKISRCQREINAGESYELCLTDQTSISLIDTGSSWNMYKHLRCLNPAPFGAYVRLGHLTLLSTSPERFMRWSRFKKQSFAQVSSCRADEQMSICQFRPMKGTVRKRQEMPDGSVHYVSREEATMILDTPKEQAENLMILDLIRHDLHGLCRDVSVPDLMVVEDYESVYQLVSVIEGKICKPSYLGREEGKSGIDCLAASLPPGSMTGAPKKRSCQILQKIEKKPRSVYSGVLGYMDVTGKGDFSVIIRSLYKWDDEDDSGTATWHVGAGGAITTLSTEDGEWEEMLTKLQSTYGLFES